MSEQCPFCHTAIPAGAIVCTGCKAELETGTAPAVAKAATFVGFVLGIALAIYNGWSLVGILASFFILGIVAATIAALFGKSRRVWVRRKQTDARAR